MITRFTIPLAAMLALTALPGRVSASPVSMTFTGVNGVAAFGYYVGPYYGQLESQNVSLYCDDFANEVNFGQTWQANLSTITAGSDLSNTRFGGVANALKDYQEIAWLDTQFAVQPSTEYGDLHATIWQIFDPGDAPAPSSSQWLNRAEASYQTMTFDNVRVVTNVGPVMATGQVQEFLTFLPPGRTGTSAAGVTTPEPAPVLLIGAGLLGFGVLLRAFRRKGRGANDTATD